MADPIPTAAPASAGGEFTVHPEADNVWRIEETGSGEIGVNAYLVAGREQALLIDTGFGLGDLAGCVRGISSLPLAVVNTHAHSDHNGGNSHFPAVHVHPLEIDDARRTSSGTEFLPAGEGFSFDLGGRTLKVIEAPGHTRGSVVLLDSAAQLLFAGDTANPVVWMFLEECLPLEVYLRTLEKLEGRSGEFDAVLPGHGAALDKAFLRELTVCARMILNGKCRGELYENPVRQALLGTYRRAGIAFDPGKLFIRG